ncbi:MAG: DUF2695 domain-containing protein [Candidatus Obscuribacterales bacterium]|nr:DUF2695 domain-containing protein [Candidatus Obscuribacterales bacterium]
MEKLGIFVSEQLSSSGCDHTAHFTASWLDSHAMGKQDQLLVAFQKFGGYCDCEILANVIAK